MPNQNEVVAVVKARKEAAEKATTSAYQTLQRRDLFSGQIRAFRPTREDELAVPSEAQNLQATVKGCLDSFRRDLIVAMDTVLTQDQGNCTAVGTVNAKVGDAVLQLTDVPAAHLLWLEKQLTNLVTIIEAIPMLDPSENWVEDTATGQYKSAAPTQVVRTRKVKRGIVLYEATEKHPAQTQLIDDDIQVGYFETIRFSGAVPLEKKRAMRDRAVALREAIKQARERANAMPVENQQEGAAILNFVFGA